MVANLLDVAGVNHIITIDLHASQMQGFFSCPVDNLVAEPLIAHWIKQNLRDWKKAVVVSKNPGGTKRVTSLADALKLNFGIVMTDRKRSNYGGAASMNTSILLEKANANVNGVNSHARKVEYMQDPEPQSDEEDDQYGDTASVGSFAPSSRLRSGTVQSNDSSEHRRMKSTHLEVPHPLTRVQTAPSASNYENHDGSDDYDDPVSQKLRNIWKPILISISECVTSSPVDLFMAISLTMTCLHLPVQILRTQSMGARALMTKPLQTT